MSFQRLIQTQPLSCVQCGDSIELKTGLKSKTYACSACGALLDTTQQPFGLLKILDNAARQPQKSPLKLGCQGVIEGVPYEIIGRIRYRGQDDEESWIWDEWQLQSSYGKFLFLQEDESGFILFDHFIPKKPLNLKRDPGPSINLELFPAKVDELAHCQIIFLEGELTWAPDLGEKVTYLDASFGATFYSIEQSDHEIQFFKGKRISPPTLFKAFGVVPAALSDSDSDSDMESVLDSPHDENIYEEDDYQEDGHGRSTFIASWFLMGGGIFLLLTGLLLSNMGTPIQSYQKTYKNITSGEKKIVGPFSMAGPRLHSMVISCSNDIKNTWVMADVALLDSGKSTLMHLEVEFSEASGSEEGESWSESDLTHSEYFRPPSKNADYFIEFVGAGSGATTFNPTIRVILFKNVYQTSYFFIFGFGLLLIGFFLMCSQFEGNDE